jgi:hypothetical protein
MPGGTALWFIEARWYCHFHIAPLPVAVLEGGRRQIFRSSGFNLLVNINPTHFKR